MSIVKCVSFAVLQYVKLTFNFYRTQLFFMRINKMSPNLCLILIIACLVLTGCSSRTYTIRANVISSQGYGVVLYDSPFSKNSGRYSNVELSQSKIYISPHIPGSWDGLALLPPFLGFEGDELPASVDIKYQYAELSGCSISDFEYPLDYESAEKPKPILDQKYYTKINCKNWHLLPDKIYSKKIDLTELNASKEMKLLGSTNRSGNRIGVILHLEFKDDGTVVTRLENTIHNRWN